MRQIQSLVFAAGVSPATVNSGRGWTAELAEQWARENGHAAAGAQLLDGAIRIRQRSSTGVSQIGIRSQGFPSGVSAITAELAEHAAATAAAAGGVRGRFVTEGELRSWADPERVRTQLQLQGGLEERDGGWLFPAVAQFYTRGGQRVVNDRLMMFREGSGAKTIRERVPDGRVKVYDGHHWHHSSTSTAGRVLTAEERPDGVYYQGWLDRTEEKLAEKLRTRVIDENSLELFILREDAVEVPMDWIPVQARRWADIAPSGNPVVREILEWMWLGIALCPDSSQGIPAILDDPAWMPFQDLPVTTSTAWNASDAAARVSAWAGSGTARIPRLARAHLARGGAGEKFLGLVADVQDGQLVVVREALEGAYGELAGLLKDHPGALAGAARAIGLYEAKLRGGLTASPGARETGSAATVSSAPSSSPAPSIAVAAPGPAFPPAAGASTAVPAASMLDTSPTGTAEAVAPLDANGRESAIRELRLDLLTLELPPGEELENESNDTGPRTPQDGSPAI